MTSAKFFRGYRNWQLEILRRQFDFCWVSTRSTGMLHLMIFVNLLARAGMPVEVINLVGDAVMKCEICRRYVRLPNRPQHKLNNAGTFNQCIQLDLFKIWGSWIFLIIDEATRYKVATLTESREATELQQHLMNHWMRYFGPPAAIVMDQEASVMSHDTAVEF